MTNIWSQFENADRESSEFHIYQEFKQNERDFVCHDLRHRQETIREGKVYPPFGTTASEGHNFVHLSVATWKSDVFRYLDETVRRRS